MSKWIRVSELAEGIDEFPPLSIQSQRNLRLKNKIKYTKLGKYVLYKKEWIEDYINSNICPAKTSQKNNNNE